MAEGKGKKGRDFYELLGVERTASQVLFNISNLFVLILDISFINLIFCQHKEDLMTTKVKYFFNFHQSIVVN